MPLVSEDRVRSGVVRLIALQDQGFAYSHPQVLLGAKRPGAVGTQPFGSVLFSQKFLGIQCRHTAHTGRGDGLAVDMVGQIACRKDTGN